MGKKIELLLPSWLVVIFRVIKKLTLWATGGGLLANATIEITDSQSVVSTFSASFLLGCWVLRIISSEVLLLWEKGEIDNDDDK